MSDFKERNNVGASPIDLSRGYSTSDVIPNQLENACKPEHVEDNKRMARMAEKYDWPDPEPKRGGFLGRGPVVWKRDNDE